MIFGKKGASVWISAVLYFGLGIIIISVLLAAGLPVVNKLKDKNIIIQSKEVMHKLDDNVREVVREGPGSQRIVTVNIRKGSFVLDDQRETIAWNFNDSRVKISEEGIDVSEGKLIVRTDSTNTNNRYSINVYTNYSGFANITNKQGKSNTLVGLNDLIIRNEGVFNNAVVVSIAEVNR
ncbi:hypothetical protein J4216_02915 [Candidatus Woesearchaeota archaeon]|nr:hypothetical protein [Candidatus Woesearchaeota archaeon]